MTYFFHPTYLIFMIQQQVHLRSVHIITPKSQNLIESQLSVVYSLGQALCVSQSQQGVYLSNSLVPGYDIDRLRVQRAVLVSICRDKTTVAIMASRCTQKLYGFKIVIILINLFYYFYSNNIPYIYMVMDQRQSLLDHVLKELLQQNLAKHIIGNRKRTNLLKKQIKNINKVLAANHNSAVCIVYAAVFRWLVESHQSSPGPGYHCLID